MKHILALLLCFSLATVAYDNSEIQKCKEFMNIIKIAEIFNVAKQKAIETALNNLPKAANDDIKNYLKKTTEDISFSELEDRIAKCIIENYNSKDIRTIIEMNTEKKDSFYTSEEWGSFMESNRQKSIFSDIGDIVREKLKERINVEEIKKHLK